MEITFNGHRNIPFKKRSDETLSLSLGGENVPFIYSGGNIRLTGALPQIGSRIGITVAKRNMQPVKKQSPMIDDKRVIDKCARNFYEWDGVIGRRIKDEAEKNVGALKNKIELSICGIEKEIDALSAKQSEVKNEIISIEKDASDRYSSLNKKISSVAGNVSDVISAVKDIEKVSSGYGDVLWAHFNDKNPHGTRKADIIGLEKVDNTSDLEKPISKATLAALDKKADKKDVGAIKDGLGELKEKMRQKELSVSTQYGGVGSSSGDVTKADLEYGLEKKVDKVAGKGLSTNDYTNEDRERLADTSGENTGDQDLSNLVEKETGKGLSTNDYTNEDKERLADTSGENTGDQDLSGLLPKSGGAMTGVLTYASPQVLNMQPVDAEPDAVDMVEGCIYFVAEDV